MEVNTTSKTITTKRNDIFGITFRMIFFQVMNDKNIVKQPIRIHPSLNSLSI